MNKFEFNSLPNLFMLETRPMISTESTEFTGQAQIPLCDLAQGPGKTENDLKTQYSTGNKSLIKKKRPIRKIIFIDDDELLCNIFKKGLEKFGYDVRVAYDGDEGLRLFHKNPADLIITDIVMPNMDGHILINEIIYQRPETNIFAVTGQKTYFGVEWNLDIAQILGAQRVFVKPIKIKELVTAIKDLEKNNTVS